MEEKEIIKKIIEETCIIDECFDVYGKDTNLGKYHELAKDIRQLLKPLIISPIMIEAEIADKIRRLYKRVDIAEINYKKQKSKHLLELLKAERKGIKEREELRDTLRTISKEYDKVLKAWYKLKKDTQSNVT